MVDRMEQLTSEVAALIGALDVRALRDATLEALRAWSASHPTSAIVQIHDPGFGPVLLANIAQSAKRPVPEPSAKEVLLSCQADPRLKRLVEVLWALTRAGILLPVAPADRGFFGTIGVTEAGLKLLQSNADHPLAPAFVDRVQRRCPNLADEVVTHLEDAEACREVGLSRPAVILLGLGYEEAIEKVLGVLMIKALVNKILPKANERIDQVRKALSAIKQAKLINDEEEEAAAAALNFADLLRRRRNDGSHTKPRYPFDDTEEIEELLRSAGRHLPGLWRLTSL
jgi:hypothetical protein